MCLPDRNVTYEEPANYRGGCESWGSEGEGGGACLPDVRDAAGCGVVVVIFAGLSACAALIDAASKVKLSAAPAA